MTVIGFACPPALVKSKHRRVKPPVRWQARSLHGRPRLSVASQEQLAAHELPGIFQFFFCECVFFFSCVLEMKRCHVKCPSLQSDDRVGVKKLLGWFSLDLTLSWRLANSQRKTYLPSCLPKKIHFKQSDSYEREYWDTACVFAVQWSVCFWESNSQRLWISICVCMIQKKEEGLDFLWKLEIRLT